MSRGSILQEASDIINGDRQENYGSPEDSFQRIANYWSIHLGVDINRKDVAEMMVLFKIARMKGQRPHRDNYTDAAGYLAIAADMLKETK